MKVLVTGAKGILGQDLCTMLMENNHEVIETDIGNLDITDKQAIRNFLHHSKPDIVIHCAAYTNVDGAESDKEKAYLINHTGSENLAISSAELELPIVYISTDYVFDGTKNSPYKPDDPVNPLNIYGLSKLRGEESVRMFNPNHYIIRTSWLYGHKGKNFVETMINLGKNNPEIKVVNDQTGCPTWTIELARGILGLITNNSPYGTYHICGSGKTTWWGFAEEIFRLTAIQINNIPVRTEEFPRPAKRPVYSVMHNAASCPDWRDSLKTYINLREEK